MNPNQLVLGNTLQHWSESAALAIALWMATWLLKKITTSYLGRIAEKRHNATYETLSQLIERTKPLFLLVLSISLAIRPLTLPRGIENFVDKALVVVVVIQFGFWGAAFLRLWIEPALLRYMGFTAPGQGSTIAALSFLIRLVFFALLTIWGLDNLGVNVSALVAGLGVGGVAVALATQNILGDLFASLSITLDQPFQVGDAVRVGTLSGTVERIGLKTTRMLGDNGEQLIFSNADLLASRIENLKRMKERRVVLRIGVTYETPSNKLRLIPDLLRKAVEKSEEVRFTYAHLAALGPSSVDFELVFWVLKPEKPLAMRHQEDILLGVIDAFKANQIEFAYPTQTIFMGNAPKT